MIPGIVSASAIFVPFDPLTLSPYFFYNVADLSTLWADVAGTTPASVNGVVKRMDDKSGNGYHLTEATNGPTLRQSGSIYWLEFDGVNDVLYRTLTNLPFVGSANNEVLVAARSIDAANDRLIVQRSMTTNSTLCSIDALTGGASIVKLLSAVSDDAGHVARAYNIADNIYDLDSVIGERLHGSNDTITVTLNGVDSDTFPLVATIGTTTTSHIVLGADVAAGPSFLSFFTGRVYGALGIQPDLSAGNRAKVVTYLGSLMGLTL